MVDQATYADLEEFARQDGVSTAHLIREAMDRYVTAREDRPGMPPELPAFAGIFSGEPSNLGTDAAAVLEATWADAIERERDPEWRSPPATAGTSG